MNDESTPRIPHPVLRRPTLPVSSLHRFVPYRDDALDAESLATGCALMGMLCVACLLFATVFDSGIAA